MSSSTQPIPISTNANRTSPRYVNNNTSSTLGNSDIDYSPRTQFNIDLPPSDIIGVDCPPQFLPRQRQGSTFQLDVFHHPAELHTPKTEKSDPFQQAEQESTVEMSSNTSPRVSIGSPMTNSISFDAARSPVLAIHHSRGPLSPDDDETGIARTISGLSLDTSTTGISPRRAPSVGDTTYVPMTPLPTHCTLSFLDRPREMKVLMQKNMDLFTLIEHALSPEKYQELLSVWKAPREKIPDEEWVQRTRKYIAIGPEEDEGGVLWTRWRELVGWDPELSSEGEELEEWNYTPLDNTLLRRWSEIEMARKNEEATSMGSYGSGIGLSMPMGTNLEEIQESDEENEEDGLDDGERIVTLGGRSRKS